MPLIYKTNVILLWINEINSFNVNAQVGPQQECQLLFIDACSLNQEMPNHVKHL